MGETIESVSQKKGLVLKQKTKQRRDGKKAIIVDLDETIIDISKKLALAERECSDKQSPKFWTVFFDPKNIVLDIVIPNSVDALQQLSKKFSIIYKSERPAEKLFEPTKNWLEENGFPEGILMLRTDFQMSALFYQKMLEELKEKGLEIVCAVDDLFHGSVVEEFYKEHGIKVIKADGKRFPEVDKWLMAGH